MALYRPFLLLVLLQLSASTFFGMSSKKKSLQKKIANRISSIPSRKLLLLNIRVVSTSLSATMASQCHSLKSPNHTQSDKLECQQKDNDPKYEPTNDTSVYSKQLWMAKCALKAVHALVVVIKHAKVVSQVRQWGQCQIRGWRIDVDTRTGPCRIKQERCASIADLLHDACTTHVGGIDCQPHLSTYRGVVNVHAHHLDQISLCSSLIRGHVKYLLIYYFKSIHSPTDQLLDARMIW